MTLSVSKETIENFVFGGAQQRITTMPMLPQGDNKIRKFRMLNCKDNKVTDELLKEYSKDFKRWANELKESVLHIDYQNYKSDKTTVTCTFNRYRNIVITNQSNQSNQPLTGSDVEVWSSSVKMC
jgi:hypothetical protein